MTLLLNVFSIIKSRAQNDTFAKRFFNNQIARAKIALFASALNLPNAFGFPEKG